MNFKSAFKCLSNVRRRCGFQLLLVAAVLGLSGCTSGMRAVSETLTYAMGFSHSAEPVSLNPQFQYLRAEINGRLAYLVLGYREPDGTEVFYTEYAETLHLRDGRIVRFTGPEIQVHNDMEESTAGLGWNALKIGDRVTYRRHADQRRGYLISQAQSVVLIRLQAPPSGLRLRDIKPGDLAWFEERIEGLQADRRSIFGVDLKSSGAEVLYSEQCLTERLCLVLQRWSAGGAF